MTRRFLRRLFPPPAPPEPPGPLDHPMFRAMSRRELADLPLPRRGVRSCPLPAGERSR
ncbi:hypothetical protein [Pseudoroseicyclus tamaricis]|uniref:Uncharacterized protein n=1 Tax=Pseudoroseicyclus tamaricis TaxID=2705421 RepID=A0A6B2JW33_9RHOB|nr:hypothetical protein [Pseudoroseicyclus tamaricis]NDV02115.1 hypothetical protein [Pseudoroseicyclus tamaricis]